MISGDLGRSREISVFTAHVGKSRAISSRLARRRAISVLTGASLRASLNLIESRAISGDLGQSLCYACKTRASRPSRESHLSRVTLRAAWSPVLALLRAATDRLAEKAGGGDSNVRVWRWWWRWRGWRREGGGGGGGGSGGAAPVASAIGSCTSHYDSHTPRPRRLRPHLPATRISAARHSLERSRW